MFIVIVGNLFMITQLVNQLKIDSLVKLAGNGHRPCIRKLDSSWSGWEGESRVIEEVVVSGGTCLVVIKYFHRDRQLITGNKCLVGSECGWESI